MPTAHELKLLAEQLIVALLVVLLVVLACALKLVALLRCGLQPREGAAIDEDLVVGKRRVYLVRERRAHEERRNTPAGVLLNPLRLLLYRRAHELANSGTGKLIEKVRAVHLRHAGM